MWLCIIRVAIPGNNCCESTKIHSWYKTLSANNFEKAHNSICLLNTNYRPQHHVKYVQQCTEIIVAFSRINKLKAYWPSTDFVHIYLPNAKIIRNLDYCKLFSTFQNSFGIINICSKIIYTYCWLLFILSNYFGVKQVGNSSQCKNKLQFMWELDFIIFVWF